MKKVLVIGASGNIGRLLFKQHLAAITPAIALVRDSSKVEFDDSVQVIEADLEQDISPAMNNVGTVIFTAGSGASTGLDKTLSVDLWGARKAIDAAKKSGVDHFIMVSSRGADNPDNGPTRIKPYLIAKHFADEYLIHSGLSYTILRPGRLTDDQGSDLIDTQRPTDPEKQKISRATTAKVIAHCLNNPHVKNNIYELFDGTQTIATAVN